jgi:hypothetical protein
MPTRIDYKPSTNTTENSIIDYFLSTTNLLQADLKIRTDLAALGSDHKLIFFSFIYDNTTIDGAQYEPTFTRKRWKIKRLSEKPVRKEYTYAMQRQFYAKGLRSKSQEFVDFLITCYDPSDPSPYPDDILENIETLTTDFYDSIYYALDTLLTPALPRPRQWTWFWNTDLQTYANYRQACFIKWTNSIGFDKPIKWKIYKQADKKLKNEIKKARATAFLTFCDSLDKSTSDATRTITRIIRSKTRSKQVYSSSDGPQAAVNEMATYLEGIYDGKYIPQPKNIPLHLQEHDPIPTSEDTQNEYNIDLCPFDQSSVIEAIKRLSRNKSPGVDHIISEMLFPVKHILAPILTNIFRACWLTSYTPIAWRTSQVVALYKKGNPLDPSCYRPISLTSVFRKVMEYCIQHDLYTQTSFIDVAQGGFKPSIGALDQAVCLDEIMHRYQQQHYHYPTIAFLDIQKAYDTVDRSLIWDSMYKHGCDPLLLLLLKNLFDDIQVQVIGGNYISHSFFPLTGVLQGSVLSPHLYSIYINSLPQLLRSSLTTINDPPNISDINCLLFADDVALVAAPDKLQNLLDLAEQHSLLLGYRWSPDKCVILSHPSTTTPSTTPSSTTTYTLYNTAIATTPSFRYLGMYFNYKGMDTQLFITNTKKKVTTTMNLFHKIGTRTNGFSLLLSIKIYKQYIRPIIEYGLCVTNFINTNFPALERLQDDCLRLIVGGFKTSSVKALRVMVNIPSLRDRWYILNTKYNYRLTYLPEDSLIHLISTTNSRYSKLTLIAKKNPIHKLFLQDNSNCSPTILLKNITNTYRKQALIDSSEKMIQACRTDLILDPIFIVPMTRKERRRMLRWRLNWLPGMKIPCRCGGEMSRNHVSVCPAIPEIYWEHIQLTTSDKNPIDLVIKSLPHSKPKTTQQKKLLIQKWQPLWTNLLNILFIVDEICHKTPVTFAEELDMGQLYYNWLMK